MKSAKKEKEIKISSLTPEEFTRRVDDRKQQEALQKAKKQARIEKRNNKILHRCVSKAVKLISYNIEHGMTCAEFYDYHSDLHPDAYIFNNDYYYYRVNIYIALAAKYPFLTFSYEGYNEFGHTNYIIFYWQLAEEENQNEKNRCIHYHP